MTDKIIVVGEFDGAYKRDCLVFSGGAVSLPSCWWKWSFYFRGKGNEHTCGCR